MSNYVKAALAEFIDDTAKFTHGKGLKFFVHNGRLFRVVPSITWEEVPMEEIVDALDKADDA